MATDAVYGDDGLWWDEIRSWDRPAIRVEVAVRPSYTGTITEMKRWCADPGRAGLFDYGYCSASLPTTKGRIFFLFTDPDTAFEFKMRWG